MKKYILIILLGLITVTALPQNAYDALRFSMLGFGGTARYMGTAGAFGAIGADFSTLSSNPAGIGLFRSSELTFSPNLQYNLSEATYNDTYAEDDRYNFNISNAGVVFAMGSSRNPQSKWKKIQMGFGFNRLDNYNNNTAIEGDNRYNSIIAEFQAKAKGIHPDNLHPFDTKLAWDTYLLLDTIRDNNGILTYTSIVPDGGVRQMKFIEQRGAQNEMVLTLGGNFDDKLYIGGTIGFPSINYRETATYREVDRGDSIPGFRNLSIEDNIRTSGSGVNFKFGLIARPFDWVRIGAAVHTPTFFNMRDEYDRTIRNVGDIYTEIKAVSPKGSFDYNLRTPLSGMINLGFMIKQFGFIGIDYEVVDYSEAKFESRGDSFHDVNQIIRKDYKAANNIRVGGEVNLNPFRVRAGYAIYGSPYSNDINDLEKTSLSFGLGFRDQNYFLDAAWVMTSYSEDYYLYNPDLVNAAKIDRSSNAMILTFGVRF
jgi:hypothetical protein